MFRILVVDDDKNTRLLLKAVLQAENYTVFTAENGENALAVMDQEHIDLVVLDIMMPKMDGYTFTKTLRETNNNLPILMISAKQLPEDKHKGFLVGTDDYMTKPFSLAVLLAKTRALIRRRTGGSLNGHLSCGAISVDVNRRFCIAAQEDIIHKDLHAARNDHAEKAHGFTLTLNKIAFFIMHDLCMKKAMRLCKLFICQSRKKHLRIHFPVVVFP